MKDLNTIIDVVCDFYHVSRSEAMQVTQKHKIVLVRQVIMYFARYKTDKKVKEISREVGGKKHNNVIHSCKRIQGLIRVDKGIRSDVNELELQLN